VSVPISEDGGVVSLAPSPESLRAGILGDIPQRPIVSRFERGSASVAGSEEIRAALPPEPSIKDLIAAAEADIRKMAIKREELEAHTAQLMRERKSLEDSIVPVQRTFKEVTARLSDIERSEHTSVDPMARRTSEADRWSIVQERYRIEMDLAQQREKLDRVIAAITNDEKQYQELEKEEALLRKRIETLESEEERRELTRSLEAATKTCATISAQLDTLKSERERLSAMLNDLGVKEMGYESRSGKIGELEERALSAEELRRLAQERYELEKERHETEVARWKAEDDIAALETQYQAVAAQIAEAEARRVEIERKIRALGT
jgi:chromosome segregation ATPase